MQPCWIDEHEILKILLSHVAALDQFMRLGHALANIRHVPMRYIGTEHGIQMPFLRALKGVGIDFIVRLAAEKKVAELRPDVVFTLAAAGLELIDLVRVLEIDPQSLKILDKAILAALDCLATIMLKIFH